MVLFIDIFGRATALRLASQGAKIVVADLSAANVQEVVGLIGDKNAIGAVVDVCDEKAVRDFMAEVGIRFVG
jgi:NAD(P)-dependent dehydrogenase (short-subunit alcohol dehydrogenase family)